MTYLKSVMKPCMLCILLLPYVSSPDRLRMNRETEDPCLREIFIRKKDDLRSWKGLLWFAKLWTEEPSLFQMTLLLNPFDGFFFQTRTSNKQILVRRSTGWGLESSTARDFVREGSQFQRSFCAEQCILDLRFKDYGSVDLARIGGPQGYRSDPPATDWTRVEVSREKFLEWAGRLDMHSTRDLRKLLAKLTRL